MNLHLWLSFIIVLSLNTVSLRAMELFTCYEYNPKDAVALFTFSIGDKSRSEVKKFLDEKRTKLKRMKKNSLNSNTLRYKPAQEYPSWIALQELLQQKIALINKQLALLDRNNTIDLISLSQCAEWKKTKDTYNDLYQEYNTLVEGVRNLRKRKFKSPHSYELTQEEELLEQLITTLNKKEIKNMFSQQPSAPQPCSRTLQCIQMNNFPYTPAHTRAKCPYFATSSSS